MLGARPAVGVCLDVRNPGGRRAWPALYEATLARIAAAERAGLDAVWVAEHHGFADGHMPQPLLFCAALAARTRRIRIGTAVALAPLVHEQALAEQAAVVDLLSGGRLELGLGAGWRAPEFESFGVDRAGRYDALERLVHGIAERWRDGRATPAPLRQPLPLWVGGRGPRGAAIAGRAGAGLLWIDAALLEPYLAALTGAGHDPARARMGGFANLFLADDPAGARAAIAEHGRRQRAGYLGAERAGRPQAAPRLQVLTAAGAAQAIAELVDGLPVTDVFCMERMAGMDDELPARHLELVATALPALLAEALEPEPAPWGGARWRRR